MIVLCCELRARHFDSLSRGFGGSASGELPRSTPLPLSGSCSTVFYKVTRRDLLCIGGKNDERLTVACFYYIARNQQILYVFFPLSETISPSWPPKTASSLSTNLLLKTGLRIRIVTAPTTETVRTLPPKKGPSRCGALCSTPHVFLNRTLIPTMVPRQ